MPTVFPITYVIMHQETVVAYVRGLRQLEERKDDIVNEDMQDNPDRDREDYRVVEFTRDMEGD